MPSDTIRSRYRLRVQEVVRKTTELQTVRGQLEQSLQSLTQEVEALSSRLDTLAKVGQLFRALMDKLVMNHVRSIEGVVTEGLRTIFVDQDLTFEAEVSQRYNKIAIDFYIVQQDKKRSIRAHPLDAFGGGPTSVASLILKVLAMRRLNKWPMLALDESLAGVSDEYIDRTGLFLKELAAKTGFNILLVTHKPAFLDHADIGYSASEKVNTDGSRELQLSTKDRRNANGR